MVKAIFFCMRALRSARTAKQAGSASVATEAGEGENRKPIKRLDENRLHRQMDRVHVQRRGRFWPVSFIL